MCTVVIKAKTDARKAVVVVNAVCVNQPDNSLLLVLLWDKVSGKYVWIFPGGKVDGNETLKDALRRELREEITDAVFVLEGDFDQKTFSGETPFSRKSIEVHVCEVSCMGGQAMRPSREIAAFYWIYPWQAELILNEGIFDDGQGHCCPVSAVTMEILEYLLKKGGGYAFVM